MGMRIWVSKICSIQNYGALGLTCFALDCLDSNSLLLGPLFHPRKGYRPANRRRASVNPISSIHLDAAFSHPRTGYCVGCDDVQSAHPLSNTATQNCNNLWQKIDSKPCKQLCQQIFYEIAIMNCVNLNNTMSAWSLRPDFGIPYRNYVSRAGSADRKSAERVWVSKLGKSNIETGDSEEGHGDEIIEKKKGFVVEEYEYSGEPVDFGEVERVYKVVEELFASDRNMEAVLDQCGVNLSHSLVYHVLSRFSNARKPALRFFTWAGKQAGFSHSSLTYNMMISILGRTRQFVTMCELLEEMGNKGSVLTIETFEIAIKSFANVREMKKALHMFSLMERYKFGANTNNFNFLLDALGRTKLAEEAHMLFERMRERFPPDAKTYTVLLSGWCKVKNLIQAGKLWNEMVDEGFKPDLVTHNIMLEGLFMGRREDEAVKLFDLMKRNGPSPNTRSYTIVIHALCKLHKIGEAMKFFAEMQENGCPIDAAVYTCLIKGYGTAKKLDQAYQLLQEMKEKGIPRDCQTYNALIKVMVNLYKPDEATKLYNEMIQCGFEPTIHTYNMLMKLYFATRKSGMGFDIWNQMIQNGCSPDANSYTVFIGGLIREGRSQEACSYIESMIEKGMKAPRFDYDKFIANFSRADTPDIFEELAEKMKQTGKLDIADVFTRYSQEMEKKVKRRHVAPIGVWSSGELGRFPRRRPRF